MISKVSVTFTVPVKSFEVLEILQQQNTELDFKLNPSERTITLSASLRDFKDYTNDWDSMDEINDYLRKVE